MPPQYDMDATSIRIGGVEVMHPRIGTREDMYGAIVTAIHDTLNEQLPMGMPHAEREAVRQAASLVVENIEAQMRAAVVRADEAITHAVLGAPKPVRTHWQRLRRLG